MPFVAKVHVQTMVSAEMLATIARWLDDQGTPAVSMSNLLTMAIEALADAIVAGGGTAISSIDEAEHVLEQIGRGRARRSMVPKVTVKDKMSAATFDEAVRIAQDRYGARFGSRKRDEDGEILASEADEGEFSADALRHAQEEQQ